MSKFQDAMRRVILEMIFRASQLLLLTAAPRPKSANAIWADCSRFGRTPPSGL